MKGRRKEEKITWPAFFNTAWHLEPLMLRAAQLHCIGKFYQSWRLTLTCSSSAPCHSRGHRTTTAPLSDIHCGQDRTFLYAVTGYCITREEDTHSYSMPGVFKPAYSKHCSVIPSWGTSSQLLLWHASQARADQGSPFKKWAPFSCTTFCQSSYFKQPLLAVLLLGSWVVCLGFFYYSSLHSLSSTESENMLNIFH